MFELSKTIILLLNFLVLKVEIIAFHYIIKTTELNSAALLKLNTSNFQLFVSNNFGSPQIRFSVTSPIEYIFLFINIIFTKNIINSYEYKRFTVLASSVET